MQQHWLNLENIILSERSKSIETEGRLMVAKVWREKLEK